MGQTDKIHKARNSVESTYGRWFWFDNSSNGVQLCNEMVVNKKHLSITWSKVTCKNCLKRGAKGGNRR